MRRFTLMLLLCVLTGLCAFAQYNQGSIIQETAAPAAPSAGFGRCWFDATDHAFECVNSSGVRSRATTTSVATLPTAATAQVGLLYRWTGATATNSCPAAGAGGSGGSATALCITHNGSTWQAVLQSDGAGNFAIGATVPGAVTTASGTVANWNKYTCDVSTNAGFLTCNGVKGDALAAATTQQFALFTKPAKVVFGRVIIEHTTPFAGTAIAAATTSYGTASSPTLITGAYNVFQATAGALPYVNGGALIGARTSATLAVILEIKTTGANLSALTAGSVDIYLEATKLP